VFGFLFLFIFYHVQCFELGGRKGDQENSELYENRIKGQKCQFNLKQRKRVIAEDWCFVVPKNGSQAISCSSASYQSYCDAAVVE